MNSRIVSSTLIIILMLVCFSLVGFVSQADAQAVGTLSLFPNTASVDIGGTFTAQILLNTGGKDVITGVAYINYDTSRLSVVDFYPSDPLKYIDVTGSVLESVVVNRVDAGQIKLEGMSVGTLMNGSNLLLGTITFKAENAGSATAAFAANCYIGDAGTGANLFNLSGSTDGAYTVNPPPLVGALSTSPVAGSCLDNSNCEVGNIFSITIDVNTGGVGTDGVDITNFNYNSTVLQLESINTTAGVLYPVTDVVDTNTPGRVHIIQVSNSGTPVNGLGKVATLNFSAIASGNTGFSFDFTPGSPSDCNISKYGDTHEDILASAVATNYTIGAAIAPGNVTNMTAVARDEEVALSWTNPSDADFAGTVIMRKTTGFSVDVYDGTFIYYGDVPSHVDSGLVNGTTYYYTGFAADEVPNFSNAVPSAQVSTIPAPPLDFIAPGPVSSFSASAGDGLVNLSWINPSDADFTGSKVCVSTSAYPIDTCTAIAGCNKAAAPNSADSCVHNGVNGTTYYYAAFAYDAGLNYSVASQASATPQAVLAPLSLTARMESVINNNYSANNVGVYFRTTDAADNIVHSITGSINIGGSMATNVATADLPFGSYDLQVDIPYYLTKRQAVTWGASGLSVNLGSFLAGDIAGTAPVGEPFITDNAINSLDWTNISSNWGAVTPPLPSADITRDGFVNTLDWHYVNQNWGASGL